MLPATFASNSDPGLNAAAVTKHDTNLLAHQSRGLYIGTGGDVTVTMAGGGDITFSNVPDGSILPVAVTRVKATGTTATDIVNLY